MIKNVCWSSRYSGQILMQLEFSPQFFLENTQISNFNKTASRGTEFFRADGQADRHDEANSHFSQFW
jgi:hypothetical protein